MVIKIKENRKSPGCYDLFVDGHRKIECESMTVCDNVWFSLVHHIEGEYSEADEIAHSILADMN